MTQRNTLPHLRTVCAPRFLIILSDSLVCQVFLCRFYIYVTVALHSGAGWYKFTNNDVLLKAKQRIHLALNDRVSQDAGRLLEGSSRQEGVRGKRGLRDTHEHRRIGSLLEIDLAVLNTLTNLAVLSLQLALLHITAGQKRRIAAFVHTNLLHHLTNDNLDMLIVDINALHPVNLLDFLNQVILNGLCTTDGKHVVRIDRTFRNAGACLNLITLRDNQTRTKGNQIGTALPRFRIGNDGMTVFLDLLEGDLAGNLTDDSKVLRLAALKQLFNARQTLRNIFRT